MRMHRGVIPSRGKISRHPRSVRDKHVLYHHRVHTYTESVAYRWSRIQHSLGTGHGVFEASSIHTLQCIFCLSRPCASRYLPSILNLSHQSDLQTMTFHLRRHRQIRVQHLLQVDAQLLPDGLKLLQILLVLGLVLDLGFDTCNVQ